MKNVITRILNGVLAAGLVSAGALGLAFVFTVIFGDTALWLRILTAVLFVGTVWSLGKDTKITVGEDEATKPSEENGGVA